MLRALVVLLVLANLGSYAWQTGWLAPLGLAPRSTHEPQRVEQQLRPEAVRLLNGQRPATSASTPSSTSAATSSTPATPSAGASEVPAAPAAGTATDDTSPAASTTAVACWETGGLDAGQAELLRAEFRLLGLPDNAWRLSEVNSPGRWIVYMGRYDNAAQVNAKKAELRELGVDFREVNVSGLAPGLSLGTFSSEAAAQTALQQVLRKGVKTARVAQERAPSTSFSLRLPAITQAQRSTIQSLGPALGNRQLVACAG
jgi:hypothetical protein